VGLVASLVPPVESRLLTTKLLAYLDSKVGGRGDRERLRLYVRRLTLAHAALSQRLGAVAGSDDGDQVPFTLKGNLWPRRLFGAARGTTENFIRIGHSLIALVLAWVGGHLSRWLYLRNLGGDERARHLPSPEPSETW
jgi:hypothetical protein